MQFLKLIYLTSISLCLMNVTSCKKTIAREPISQRSGSLINTSIKRNQRLKQEEENIIKKIIKEDSLNTYLESGSGFWYFYKKQDTITKPKPKTGSRVSFEYNLRYINGDTIYSQTEIGKQETIIDKEELFFGLREGLKLLQEGEEATFIFPSQQAYGYYGDENKIGGNTPLICDIKLNYILEN